LAKTPEEQLGVDIDAGDGLAAQPQTQPPEAASEAQRPEWLPENFQNPEALVQSYRELGGKLTEQGTRLNQMQQELEQLRQKPEEPDQPAQQQYDPAEWNDYLAQQWEENPIQAAAYIAELQSEKAKAELRKEMQEFQQQQYAVQQPAQNAQYELIAYQADQIMGSQYADWEQVKPMVVQQLEADPNLMSAAEAQSPQGAAKAYTRAYKQAKYAQLEQAAAAGQPITGYDPAAGGTPPASAPSQAPPQLAPLSDLARLQKMQGQTMTGGNGRLTTPDPGDDWLARMQAGLKGQSYSAFRQQ
jgi:hypothetical protein